MFARSAANDPLTQVEENHPMPPLDCGRDLPQR
jgi:hypothetical protein